mmetsp:Transcript_2014/g.3564  ORF Transcript_2014/g.3564 Transcript_2014/m.3564 type:complete len:197 (-) Transcript_2014:331-921(-)
MAYNIAFVFKFAVLKVLVAQLSKDDRSIRESVFLRIDRETLKGYRLFFNLSMAGLFLACVEEWTNEAMSLLGGYIDVKAQAASIIVNSLSLTASYITLGFSFSLSAMIGSELGCGRVQHAKNIALQASLTCYLYVVIIMALFRFFREEIISVFIQDQEVIALATESLVAFSYVFLLDAMQQIMQGAIKGLGVQGIA